MRLCWVAILILKSNPFPASSYMSITINPNVECFFFGNFIMSRMMKMCLHSESSAQLYAIAFNVYNIEDKFCAADKYRMGFVWFISAICWVNKSWKSSCDILYNTSINQYWQIGLRALSMWNTETNHTYKMEWSRFDCNGLVFGKMWNILR